MSRKDSTPRRRSPRKAELLAALQGFTTAVKNAGGIRVIESGTARKTKGPNLAQAYAKACRLLNQEPEPVTKDSPDDYEAQASYLLVKYGRLAELAEKRGYSSRAVAALVLSAAQAEMLREAGI